MDNTMRMLRDWLRTHTYQDIATKLNYKSTSTISRWLKNKTIPNKDKPNVERVIRETR